MKTFAAAGLASLIVLSLSIPEPVDAADRGRSKQSISRASNGGGAQNRERRPVRQETNNRNRQVANDRNSNNRRGNNNVVAGNTVVVNHNTDRGYNHHGYDHDYYDDWDDDDGFFEVVGKAAAVTAGVGLTAAVIGEIFEDEPDDCQQSMAYGQTYLYCNGIWYQPTMSGSNVQYVVVEDPN